MNNREMPDICLQHMVSVMLLDKTASFAAAHDKPRMQDPTVLKQRAKVDLVADEELQRLMPQRQAIVEVILSDGTRLTERVEAVRGTPANPMDLAEVRRQVPRPDGARSGPGKGRSADSDGDDARSDARHQAAPSAAPAVLTSDHGRLPPSIVRARPGRHLNATSRFPAGFTGRNTMNWAIGNGIFPKKAGSSETFSNRCSTPSRK